jgi:hypothetical protein
MNFSRFLPCLFFMHHFKKLAQPIHQIHGSGDARRHPAEIARQFGRSTPRTALIVNDPRK